MPKRVLKTSSGFVYMTPRDAVASGFVIEDDNNVSLRETINQSGGVRAYVKSVPFYDFMMNMTLHVAKRQATGGKGNSSIKTIAQQDIEDTRGDSYVLAYEGINNYLNEQGENALDDIEVFKLVLSSIVYKIGNAYAYRSHRAIGTPSVDALQYDDEGNAHKVSDIAYNEYERERYNLAKLNEAKRITGKVYARFDKIPVQLIDRVNKYLNVEDTQRFLLLLDYRVDNNVILTGTQRSQFSRLQTKLLKVYALENSMTLKQQREHNKQVKVENEAKRKVDKLALCMTKRLNAYITSKDALTRRIEAILDVQGLDMTYRGKVFEVFKQLDARAYTTGETLVVLRPYREAITQLQYDYGYKHVRTPKQQEAYDISTLLYEASGRTK